MDARKKATFQITRLCAVITNYICFLSRTESVRLRSELHTAASYSSYHTLQLTPCHVFLLHVVRSLSCQTNDDGVMSVPQTRRSLPYVFIVTRMAVVTKILLCVIHTAADLSCLACSMHAALVFTATVGWGKLFSDSYEVWQIGRCTLPLLHFRFRVGIF